MALQIGSEFAAGVFREARSSVCFWQEASGMLRMDTDGSLECGIGGNARKYASGYATKEGLLGQASGLRVGAGAFAKSRLLYRLSEVFW